MSSSRQQVWACAILAAGLTCVAAWPVLAGAYQVDDYNLFSTWLHPDTLDVEWSRVLGELWPAAVTDDPRPFWRPLHTLQFASAISIFGVTAPALHAINLVQHLAGTLLCALLCAALAGGLGGGGGRSAALIGGVFFGMHVAVVEPVAWISASNSTAAVALLLASCWLYLRALRNGTRAPVLGSLVCAAAALLSKEDAWALPFYLVALDRLAAPRPWSLRALLRRQRPFIALWIGYGLLRSAALGYGGIGRYWQLFAPRFDDGLANLPFKLWRLVAPWSDGQLAPTLPVAVAIAGLVAIALLLGCALWSKRHRRFVVVAALLGATLLPGFANLLDERWQGARVLYVAVPPVAFALALGVDEIIARRRVVLLFPLGGVVVVASFLGMSGRLQHWTEAWQQMRAFTASVADQARDATEATPFVLLAAPREHRGVPQILPPFAHVVARRPWAEVDVPVLGATFVLEPYPGTETFGRDASLLHAFAEGGSRLGLARGADLLVIDAAERRAGLRIDGAKLVASTPIAPFALEVIEASAPTSARRWQAVALGAGESAVGHVVEETTIDGRRCVTIDLSRDLRIFATAVVGALRGIEVRATDEAGAALPVRIERIGKRVPRIELVASLADAPAVDEPRLQAPAGGGPLRLVLFAESVIHTLLVEPGQRIDWSRDARRWLEARRRGSPDPRVFYWFDRGAEGFGRSTIDSFRLRR